MTQVQEGATSSTPISPLAAGLKCRCPRCGNGPLFNGLLTLRRSCRCCGLDFRFIDTGDGPAVFAILILGTCVLGGALWFEFRFNPPAWQHALLWGAITPILAVGLLRVLKATLAALQFTTKAEEGRIAPDQPTDH
ncbi:MAG: hypothetical protein CTY20_10435 [Hyphomicrobium sp.]|nr:MAG: hypothetical protein CTY20_10435 [Hyphomicrobium sp.]